MVYCPAEAVTDGTELPVEDTRIADMELTKNTLLEYLFDFGDRWWFDIKVKAIYEGKAERAEITDFYGKAPAQYPDWEEEGYYCTISNEQKVWDILQEIDDESVEIDYTAVFEMRDERHMRTDDPEKRRERIADMVLSNPEDMMSFFQDEVRHLLFCCMQEDEWIDRDSQCELMKLYSLGFCKVEQDEIIIPEEIRSVYEAAGETIKGNILADQIAELAEKYLNLCGVIEMSTLYELIRPMIRKKYEYRDFRWWVFSHLVFWGRYEMWEKDRTEYMSLYDENLTWKIIEEREKYENESYPVFTKKALLEQKEYAGAKNEWKDYINFSLSINRRSANELIYRIPCLIASGVIAQDELIAYYGDEIRKAGGRKTKKAEKIIQKMYQELRVATRRGNLQDGRKSAAEGKKVPEGKKETALKEKMAPKRENGTVSRKKSELAGENRIDSTKKKETVEWKMDGGYVQLSLFDDM